MCFIFVFTFFSLFVNNHTTKDICTFSAIYVYISVVRLCKVVEFLMSRHFRDHPIELMINKPDRNNGRSWYDCFYDYFELELNRPKMIR